MTLARFQELLKNVNPRLRLRQRNYGDIVALCVGLSGKSGYIARMTKGELTLAGYRRRIINPLDPMHYMEGNIQKRGRKTIVMLLKNYRWIKSHKERSMLLWGITPTTI